MEFVWMNDARKLVDRLLVIMGEEDAVMIICITRKPA
jgi:hypothetical protein